MTSDATRREEGLAECFKMGLLSWFITNKGCPAAASRTRKTTAGIGPNASEAGCSPTCTIPKPNRLKGMKPHGRPGLKSSVGQTG